MKKLYFLSIIFFFALALAGFTPVKADSIVVNGSYEDSDTLSQADYDELQNTALLLEYLRHGGVIDTSNVSAAYSVSDLVSDFGNFVKEVVPDVVDVINPFQSKFEYTPLGNAMLNSNMTKFLGLLPFYALSGEQEEPQPTPPADYTYYIDLINGSGFDFIRNLANFNMSQTPPIQNYPWYNNFPWTNRTFYKINRFDSTTNWNINSINFGNPIFGVNQIDDIYITSNNGQYSVTLNPFFNYDLPLCYSGSYDSNTNIPIYKNCIYGTSDGTYGNVYLGNGNYSGYNWGSPVTRTDSNLVDLFDWLSQKVRNVNIYVDGDLWSTGNQNTNFTLTLYNDTVPDIATNDYGYVHWVYDYEIFFRIDRIWDILQDILDNMGNGGQTIIRWPDIDDVIVDVDGQPAVAVKIYTPDSNIDEDYISTYGPLVPIFIPLATPVINDSDILLIATTPMSALPDDLLDVYGYIFIGCLFVCFIHRLLE